MDLSTLLNEIPRSTLFLVSAVVGILSVGVLAWGIIVLVFRMRHGEDER